MMHKRHFRSGLAALLLFALLIAGCGAKTEESTASSESQQTTEAGTEESGSETLEGDASAADQTEAPVAEGYELVSSEYNELLQSELISYVHEKSGASIVCIKNDDPELAFGIFYNTPAVDETDTNHVFEHAIIASSEKYPSSDLFFDMANKSYSTFLNAFTYDTFTGYPLSTMSEEQLMTMMDAYLSCMVAPDILTDENIFKREAIRYKLTDPEAPIELTGTVYSEDFGSLTDINREFLNNVVDALYPGEIASNNIGRAHRNYQGLTYEHTRATFDRCYSFDNSLILLYGDMDYERILSFMDQEYLSKAEDRGTDLSEYFSQETEPGYVETVVECPAFNGDTSENASVISYAISLADADWLDIMYWEFLSSAMTEESSIFAQKLREAGISNQTEVGTNFYAQKLHLLFVLYQAEPEQAQSFKEAVDAALEEISENGMDQELLTTILKQSEITNYQIRDTKNAGVNIFPNIVNYWTHTGDTDYYGLYEQAFSEISADTEQTIVKRLAAAALEPERSALVTTVPTPGLAEEIIAERDQYLADMKASMTEEEIAELVEDTKEFNAWNSEGRTNSDFVIDPAQIGDMEISTDYESSETDGMLFYKAPAEVDKIGRYAIYLDSSSLTNEDIYYFDLYEMLIGMLPAGDHDAEEVMKLYAEYMSELEVRPRYPQGDSSDHAHPMLRLTWTGLTEEHEAALELLILLYTDTRIDDADAVLEIVNRFKDSHDQSRYGDFFSLANEMSIVGILNDISYKRLYDDQGFYYFLEELSERLAADSSYIDEIVKRIDEVRDKLLTRHDLIYVCSASEGELDGLCSEAAELLSALPEGQASGMSAELGKRIRKLGIGVESSDQYISFYGNIFENEDADIMKGRYVPYFVAASDRYLIPRIRFQNGAYSAGINLNTLNGGMVMYSYSDPNVAVTLDVFDGLGDAIRSLELTKKDLDGYILSSLSYSNIETGVLSGPMQAVEIDIMGYDRTRTLELWDDIKNASLEDRDQAAEAISSIFEDGNICAVGNEDILEADADCFDELVYYRGDGE